MLVLECVKGKLRSLSIAGLALVPYASLHSPTMDLSEAIISGLSHFSAKRNTLDAKQTAALSSIVFDVLLQRTDESVLSCACAGSVAGSGVEAILF